MRRTTFGVQPQRTLDRLAVLRRCRQIVVESDRLDPNRSTYSNNPPIHSGHELTAVNSFIHSFIHSFITNRVPPPDRRAPLRGPWRDVFRPAATATRHASSQTATGTSGLSRPARADHVRRLTAASVFSDQRIFRSDQANRDGSLARREFAKWRQTVLLGPWREGPA